jgi:hypothetical protein
MPGYHSAKELTRSSRLFYSIEFTMQKGEPHAQLVNGQCWQSIFRNPVVVNGYPILNRPESETGLELPLNVMAALAQTRYATFFGGKLYMKGFSTMLVPTKVVRDMVIWHLLFSEDGSHISYIDLRVEKIPGLYPVNIRTFHLQSARHVLGWCSDVKHYAGKPTEHYFNKLLSC